MAKPIGRPFNKQWVCLKAAGDTDTLQRLDKATGVTLSRLTATRTRRPRSLQSPPHNPGLAACSAAPPVSPRPSRSKTNSVARWEPRCAGGPGASRLLYWRPDGSRAQPEARVARCIRSGRNLNRPFGRPTGDRPACARAGQSRSGILCQKRFESRETHLAQRNGH